MKMRQATVADIPRILELLLQVHAVHSEGRPDIFRRGGRKYEKEDLEVILTSPETPVFVATDEQNYVLGYAFCLLEEVKNNTSLCDRKSLYIDDICVDEAARGKRVGKALYEHVRAFAQTRGIYHITLNVWCLNTGAMAFYEKCGMKPLKVVMEDIL